MIEWNKSNLWVKLSRIWYAKILTQALPNLIHESIIWQFVKNFVSIVTFALCITYTYWTLVDARVKKDKHLENQKCHFGWLTLRIHPFLPKCFFTFLVAVAHGATVAASGAAHGDTVAKQHSGDMAVKWRASVRGGMAHTLACSAARRGARTAARRLWRRPAMNFKILRH